MNGIFLELVAFAFVATKGISETKISTYYVLLTSSSTLFSEVIRNFRFLCKRFHYVFSRYYDTKDAIIVT